MKYGIIDIGSNTFRLIIADILKDTYFITDGFKENVRLSAGIDQNGKLSQEKMEYGLKTLKMLVNYCKISQCDEIRVVATAALRKATNRQDFIDFARQNIGIEVELLPGELEAEYDYVGSVNAINLKDYLFMDIGGGSTEIGLIKNRSLVNVISLPFGSVDLAQNYNLSDKPAEKDLKKLEKYILSQYKEVEWLKKAKGLPLVGIGGTIRNMGKIQTRKEDYPLSAIHLYTISVDNVFDIYDTVSSISNKDRENINGLGKDRADIFVGACGAVKLLLEYCEGEKLIISRDGLREGLLFEKIGYGKNHVAQNPLELSVNNMMIVYDVDRKHAEHVLFLFKKLFEELQEVHMIQEDQSEIIYIASMLHDVGKMIDYKNHHEHTFYIMLNSILKAVEHKKHLIATVVAGNHTSSKLKNEIEKYTKILSKEELELIDKLSLLIKLAEGLDRSLSRKVKDIMCRRVDNYVIIKTINYDDISLETAYLKTFESDFEKTFGYKMIVV
ncbi:MAG: Ppx/GppA family phosphatase [Tissierellales bacterium]|nr:Ppx/GppA family phosphatase [Tissierellales bacterium]MBN2827568.1 Ppx/GppA family phosphatase [Tissierellales bacterium]